MASKKKQEEIEKQINVKKEFADKVYKKMRADRYGLTFCCPNDLEKINVKNYMCNWQDIGYEVMPEKFDKNYTRNPIANYCAPPGIYNAVTGLCDAEAELELVGTTEFTLSESTPNGTQFDAVPANSQQYGKDCPIIFESIESTGAGANPTMINVAPGGNTWWRGYDATEGGDNENLNNPNVQMTGYCNAIGKKPSDGWPTNDIYEIAVNINVETTTMYHIAICTDHRFGISSTTSGVTTNHITLATQSPYSMVNAIGEADGSWNADGSGDYSIQTLIDQDERASNCHPSMLQYYYDGTNYNRICATRFWIYPLELAPGCHRINVQAQNKFYDGMMAVAIFQNTRTEIIAADDYEDLTVVYSTDNDPYLYQNISLSDPWTCPPPFVLLSTSPYSSDCPGCRSETSTLVQQCPEGYTYNNSRQKCEGIFPTCDTETLVFEVVNQNGEVMPNYEITFDGGTYTTNELGYLEIVVQNASVDTDHNLNLCHCITTGGGCAIQNIKITVTDSNAIICTPVDELCPCKAPALINTTTGPVLTNPSSITLTFQDFNLNNSSNTIESYIFEYRVYTAAGDGGWQTITITKPASGTTFVVNLSLGAGSTYEYRIKTKCTETESGYSGIYSITIPDTFGDDLVGWWDFTDKSSLFSDLAGTTNPANSGDPIRRVNNKSTSTYKLGNFLRSVETLGWTNVFGGYPRYATNSTINQTYVDMNTGVVGNTAVPFTGSYAAGFGGVNDGVSFSTLNNLSVQNFTIINVVNHTPETLANVSNAMFVSNFYAPRSTDGQMAGAYMILSGAGLPPGSKSTRALINGATNNENPGIVIPFVNSGLDLTILRSTDSEPNNLLGRNEWDLNNTTFYNQVIPFDPPTAVNYDFSGGAVGSYDPQFTLGGLAIRGSGILAQPWKGHFYECLVFKKALTDTELNDVVSYLKTKYGII